MTPAITDIRRRVLLVGMGGTTYTALEGLARTFEVVGLVRAPAVNDPTIALATNLGVPVYADVRLKAIGALVTELGPDCVVISSFDRIVPANMLEQTRFVNVHYAPLPKYRGRANVNWAIINGDSEAGISVHTIVPGLDAGNVLFQQLIPIGERDTVADLYDRLNAIQRDALPMAVQRHLDGYVGEVQDEQHATYGCTRLPDDGAIDWTAPTSQIDRLVRGLSDPFPGAFTFFDGRQFIIWRAAPVVDPPRFAGRVPGRVVNVSSEGFIDVLTGDGILRVLEVQLGIGPRVPAANVVRSVKSTLGLNAVDLLRRIAVLEQALGKSATEDLR